MKKIILIIIAAGVLVSFAWLTKQKPNPETSAPNNESGLIVGKNALYATEQKPGSSVLIEFAMFSSPGFVVIHESQDGNPGTVLGASALLPSGETSESVSITLSRPGKNQEWLAAVLHRDNGDGIFDPNTDIPFLENESPVMMEFLIDVQAGESGPVNL